MKNFLQSKDQLFTLLDSIEKHTILGQPNENLESLSHHVLILKIVCFLERFQIINFQAIHKGPVYCSGQTG